MGLSLRIAGLTGALATLGLISYQAAQGSPQQANGQRTVEYKKDVKPVLSKFCLGCHSGKSAAAGIDLSAAKGDADLQKDDVLWERITRALRSNQMPPDSAPQPTQEQRDQLILAIQTIVSGNCQLQDPGKVTIRRLNRTEYTNTIRDLLGVEFKAAADFPNDDVGYGFDNIGDVLTLSPLLLEKYLDAAEKLAETAILIPGSKTVRYEGDKLNNAEGTSVTGEGARNFFTNSKGAVEHTFTVDGSYRIRVNAFGTPAGPEAPKMWVGVDGYGGQTVSVNALASSPTDYELPFEIAAGKRYITIAFTNDFYDPNNPDPTKRDRNLIVNHIEVIGPVGANLALNESTRRIVPALPPAGQELAVARTQLASFASRAFRRPVQGSEVDGLIRVFKVPFENKEPYLKCMQVAVSAILVSPQFLFRAELDPKTKETSRLLNGYEIASRLSYFLWSSMPDDELLRLAAGGKLNEPKAIEAQIERMLKDPKAAALTTTFGDQWLQMGKLAGIRPDPKRFPEFLQSVRNLMIRETHMFFEDIVVNDRSILEFLDSKHTFLNNALAAYYDIPGVDGPQMRRVELSTDRRGGLLGQGSILMLTSNPTRTSPTKRGKWILEQILGTPPPPPPPGAGDLKPKADNGALLTLRQQLEAHRSNPDCASCHSKMDPLGVSLENYSAVGTWRYQDETDADVDPTGVLPDGKVFKGPKELKAILMSKKDQFARSLAEKLMIFGLGRGVTLRDDCAVDEIAAKCRDNGYRFSAMIKAIATSEPFRKRKVGAL